MKILALTNLYPPHHIGGYELICQTVTEILRERGYEIVILTSNHTATPGAPEENEPGVERTLTINGLYGHPWRRLRELRLVERENNGLLRSAIEGHRPDLVYVWNMGGLSKSMLFTLQAINIPTVFYVSDHWIARGLSNDIWLRWWNAPHARRTHALVRRFCEITGMRRRWNSQAPTFPIEQLRFRRVYFCSRALRDSTAAAGYEVAHGAVIYCPVHPRFYRGEPAAPRDKVERLLYVGRLAEDKGVMTALRAMTLLATPFKLNICGRGNPEYVVRLKRFARENHLNVAFSSATLEQMPQLYRGHDLLLFTSEWAEPFALTPIEAMASGLPVVGTATGGSAELFRHGENALVYAAGNAGELADRIDEFASDRSMRARCAAAGYSDARRYYAAPVIVDQIEAYLEATVHDWHGEGVEDCSFHDAVQRPA